MRHALCMVLTFITLAGALLWLVIFILPWRPWSTRECLDTNKSSGMSDLSQITVLIPARNESAVIGKTLNSLKAQGEGLKVVVIDDESTDKTQDAARQTGLKNLHFINGKPLPQGWSGKLWALEQGRHTVATPLTLLIDADIELLPGILSALVNKMNTDRIHFVSLMAQLRMENFWERLLMPAFVYFFKLLYPFALSNSNFSLIAAAAGGCIMLETRVLNAIGGFESIRDSLIDDCAFAKRVKAHKFKTWIGLTHSVQSHRPYERLSYIWNMVARTAFTQLMYSKLLLLLCTALLTLAFLVPAAGLFLPGIFPKVAGIVGLITMFITCIPVLRFYRRSIAWGFAMPFIGTLYLAMTWTSAFRYWFGTRSQWKNRIYSKDIASDI